jgi:DNA-binding response OmpR family regulator
MAHLDSLVVLDSNPRSSAALSFGFQREGFHVYSTADSGDALAMAQTRAAQLLVVSTQNGGSEPLDLVGKLREVETTRELPIVVLGERRVREPALRAGADEFVARPAFIRDVVTLSKLAVAMRQDGDREGVIGLLEDYGLYFLTRALAVAGRSAVLELDRQNRKGEVHISKGEVVSAKLGRMSGLPAFNQLLLWGEASMHLRFDSPTGERKINLSVDEVLTQGAEFAKTFDQLAERIGGAQAVFRQSPTRAADARSQIPPEVLSLVKLYDGKRPVIDLVEDSPFKPVDTIKISFRLLELGAIERIESTHVDSPLTARLAVRDWLLGAPGGGDDRSTVTEAGRRAAEAYAEEEARRAKEKRPSEDLLPVGADTLVDVPRPTLAPPKNGAGEPAAPQMSIHDAPTAPLSKKERRKLKQQQQRQADAERRRPQVEADATIPFSKISVPPSLPEPEPQKAQPEPQTAQSEPQQAKPEPQKQKPQPQKQKPQPQKAQPQKAQPQAKAKPDAGKLTPAAAASAHPKEPVFSDVDEEFFAKEAELHKVEAVESFDDLDTKPKTPAKRSWFGWGEKPSKKK